MIRDAYKNQSYKIYSGTTGNNSKYITVRIDEKTSFSYYDSGSLHYIQTVTTKLGKRASIQISSKYGNFNNASISFHISGYGTDYSVGFATIDITKETIAIDYFKSTINNLNLNEAEMLKELNDNILSVLNNFKDYMHYTFNLALY